MNKHPLRPVTNEDVARFGDDGAVCVRNVFDREWCARMNAAVERLLLNPGKRAREATKAGDSGRFHMNAFMWRWDPDFCDFALHSPLPELGATLLGADRVSLFYDQAFIKEGGTHSPTDWHQDLPFWPALGNDIISLWVALTPVTVEGQWRRIRRRIAQMGQVLSRRHARQGRALQRCQARKLSGFFAAQGRPAIPFSVLGVRRGQRHLPSSARCARRQRQWVTAPPRRDFGTLCRPRRLVGSAAERDEDRRRAGDQAARRRSADPGRRVSDHLGTGARGSLATFVHCKTVARRNRAATKQGG